MARTSTVRTDKLPFKNLDLTDPAENAAVTTAIIDTYSAIVITTTEAATTQTLQDPTDTGDVVRFTVINDDDSTDPIIVNGVTIRVGGAEYFIWDGDDWTAGGSGADLIRTITETGNADISLLSHKALTEFTNGASDLTFTTKQFSDVPLAVGSWFEISKTGTGDLTIAKGTGVTFRGLFGDNNFKLSVADGGSVFGQITAASTYKWQGSVKAA